MNRVILGPEYFPSPDIGRPVSGAQIFVGIVDRDPEIVINQKQLSVLQEDTTTVEVSQPVLTGAGGVPIHNGSPVTILVDGDYSLKVLDSSGSQIYYVPSDAGTDFSVNNVDDMLGLINISGQLDGDTADVLGYFVSFPQSEFNGGGSFVWQSGLDKNLANGGTIIDPDNIGVFDGTVSTRDAFLATQGTWAGTGCWVKRNQESVDFYDFGAVGSGVIVDHDPIQAAVDYGGENRIPIVPMSGSYLTDEEVNVTFSDTTIEGGGDGITEIIVDDSASINSGVLLVASTLDDVTIKGLTIDGNSDNNTLAFYSGIYSLAASTRISIEGNTIKNMPSSGILLAATTFANKSFTIKSNELSNIGWRGIHVEFGDTGSIDGNSIISSGSHGIVVEPGSVPTSHPSRAVNIANNFVDRSVSPTTILTNQVESGFLIGIGAVSIDIIVSNNTLNDNRNAGDDGIGLGEDATTPQTRINISDNIVNFAGQFGIDATNVAIVQGNTVSNSGEHGIVVASDLGEDMSFAMISNNHILNSNESDTGVISGIHVNSLVPGTLMDFINITDNVVFDGRSPKQTSYGITLNPENIIFGLNVNIRNNDLTEVLTAGFNPVGSSIVGLSAHGNNNFLTHNSGQAQVLDTTTSLVVNHGLAITPLIEDITLSALTGEAAGLGAFTTSVTSTTFTINTPSAAGASTSFAWTATAAKVS